MKEIKKEEPSAVFNKNALIISDAIKIIQNGYSNRVCYYDGLISIYSKKDTICVEIKK